MKPQKSKVTPGPYGIRDSGYGYSVTGNHGVAIAWFSVASVSEHTITLEEAKANAEFLLESLRKADET